VIFGGETLTKYLKNNLEPPPAATVLMSSWGAWIVTPAVVVSKTWSNVPENLKYWNRNFHSGNLQQLVNQTCQKVLQLSQPNQWPWVDQARA